MSLTGSKCTSFPGEMSSQLPAELVKLILESLCVDVTLDVNARNACLRSLCLASRSLKQMAEPLLYNNIELSSSHRAGSFLASSLSNRGVRLYLRYLWCGVVSELLYDVPHGLAGKISIPAQEVAWMQSDSDGRYHGFHYSTRFLHRSHNDVLDGHSSNNITAFHVVCPDFGRWIIPLFSRLPYLEHVSISLYPKGNWDLEEAKIEMYLLSILRSCSRLRSLNIIVGHTPAAAGSRMVRMSRSLPIAHAVRRIRDDRISVSAAEYLFGVYGRSPSEEIIQYTHLLWDDRRRGLNGPWAEIGDMKG